MVINVEVTPKPYETIEKTLRRFAKKCSKENIKKQHTESLVFVSKREKKRQARLKALRKARKKKQRF